jgi:hypothetical protein
VGSRTQCAAASTRVVDNRLRSDTQRHTVCDAGTSIWLAQEGGDCVLCHSPFPLPLRLACFACLAAAAAAAFTLFARAAASFLAGSPPPKIFMMPDKAPLNLAPTDRCGHNMGVHVCAESGVCGGGGAVVVADEDCSHGKTSQVSMCVPTCSVSFSPTPSWVLDRFVCWRIVLHGA